MSWFGVKKAEFKPGFRDLKWGDPPVIGMALLQKDGDDELYMRANDSLRIGEGRLKSINYQYWRKKLHGVRLHVAEGSIKQVMEAIKAVYGKPTQPNPLVSKYFWKDLGLGEGATGAVADVDANKSAGTIIIFSKTLMERRKSEEAAAS